ncbi:MAG TPA: hypothetical protein VK968_19615 [Roseimicrobium sp.]|nr:hypothetical protein [Roseimicrobium sp.]
MQFSAKTHSKGFALLITITLLAFLVLLLVSLASLTRVETQIASNNQQLAQARQNALMALNIALGELQKYTGPDQRTTARSDMDATLANTPTQSGRWLGAYGRAVATADTTTRDIYTDIPSKIQTDMAANSDTNGRQAVLLNWLVSGNERTGFSPAAAIDPNGQITRALAPTTFAFAPTDAVNLTATPTALSTSITIATKPARLLVGGNSVTAPSDYVAAPLVDISVSPGIVPGTDPTASVTAGRYAWWVGDEGAKARLNVSMPTNAQAPLAFVSAQRSAIELVDGKNPVGSSAAFATTDLIGSSYPTDSTNTTAQEQVTRLMNGNQLPLLTPANATALAAAAKYRFHDLSAYSTSVLADTYAGGLKKDLSTILATGASSPLDTDFIFNAETNTGAQSNEFGVPTWGQLRSYVQITPSATSELVARAPKTTKLATRPTSTPQEVPIAPVMTYATLGFAYGVPNNNLALPLPADTVGNPIHLAAFPIIVLWNPYTTAIAATRYEVGFRKNGNGYWEFQTAPAGTPSNDTTSAATAANKELMNPAWTVIKTEDLDHFMGASDPYLRFLVDAPSIPAGQSYVFTLDTPEAPYSAGLSKLTYGYRKLNHVLMPATTTVATAGMIYRIGVNAHPSWNYCYRTAVSSNAQNFGNADAATAYLRLLDDNYAVPPVVDFYSTPPKNNYPYNHVSPFVSVGVVQWLGPMVPTGYNYSPYGQVQGFSRVNNYGAAPHPAAGDALLRAPLPIGLIDEPTFELSFSMLFNNSSSRWLAVHNPRAFISSPTRADYNPKNWRPLPGNATWPPSLSVLAAPATSPITAPRAASGLSLGGSTLVDTTLYEFRPDTQPLLSIGQLQHANLSWLGGNPSYAIGNSLGDPYLASNPANVMAFTPSGDRSRAPYDKSTAYYDLSWLLNRSLWDRYFVSTVPNAGTGKNASPADTASTTIPATLANPLHIDYGARNSADLRDATRAASKLLLSGGFNINSTSEQAWRAVLGATNNLPYDPVTNATGGSGLDSAVSRFSKPLVNPPSAITNVNAWTGYRVLTKPQIAQLAKNIVDEIRKRGPFISMADFINRRLKDNGAFPLDNDSRLKGTIQAALDINSNSTNVAARINDPATTLFTTADVISTPASWESGNDAFHTGSSTAGAVSRTAPYSSKSAFAPQYVTQADILSTIAAKLAARSDTFVIRSYGESLNPALTSTDSGYITGRAWCEAVVQRVPDYVNTTTNAYAAPTTGSDNQKFGRRFKIISFRWLSPNDI